MLKKFVYWSGASDFLVGFATIGAAIYNSVAAPVPGQFTALMTLGMFLCMAAGLLMWASHDMKNRAPVLVWQGLVRLTAISSIIYAVPNGLAQSPYEYYLIPWDGTIGIVYIIGAIKVTGCSLPQLLCGKTDPK
jgi:hypothetical protein